MFISFYKKVNQVCCHGNYLLEEILQILPTDPHALLKTTFLSSIVNGTDVHSEALINNMNHYNFKSTSPLLLLGTKGDHDVPYHGAEIAYKKLKLRSNTIFIRHVSDVLDHVQAFPIVTKEQLKFFRQYEH